METFKVSRRCDVNPDNLHDTVMSAALIYNEPGNLTTTEENPKKAYGDAKVALHLVPPVLEIYAALKLKEGAIKYGEYNYREIPVEMMTYIAAMKRHLAAIFDGEWMDPSYSQEVNGKVVHFPATPHLAGLIASAAIMADAYERGTIIDNRPAKGSASELLNKYMAETPNRDTAKVQGTNVESDSDMGERCSVDRGQKQ